MMIRRPVKRRGKHLIFLRRGESYEEAGRYDEALEAYLKGLRELGPSGDQNDKTYIYGKLGKIYFGQEDWENARKAYWRLFKSKPSDKDAEINYYNSLAEEKLQRGELDAAETCVRDWLSKYPDAAEPHLMLSRILYQRCKVKKIFVKVRPDSPLQIAEDEALRALELHPNMPAALEHLLRMYQETGQDAKAVEIGNKIDLLQPGFGVSQRRLILALGQSRQYEKESEVLERVNKNKKGASDYEEQYFLQARMWNAEDREDFQNALSLFNELKRKSKKRKYTHELTDLEYKGKLLLLCGRIKEAIKVLRTIHRMKAKDKTFQFNRYLREHYETWWRLLSDTKVLREVEDTLKPKEGRRKSPNVKKMRRDAFYRPLHDEAVFFINHFFTCEEVNNFINHIPTKYQSDVRTKFLKYMVFKGMWVKEYYNDTNPKHVKKIGMYFGRHFIVLPWGRSFIHRLNDDDPMLAGICLYYNLHHSTEDQLFLNFPLPADIVTILLNYKRNLEIGGNRWNVGILPDGEMYKTQSYLDSHYLEMENKYKNEITSLKILMMDYYRKNPWLRGKEFFEMPSALDTAPDLKIITERICLYQYFFMRLIQDISNLLGEKEGKAPTRTIGKKIHIAETNVAAPKQVCKIIQGDVTNEEEVNNIKKWEMVKDSTWLIEYLAQKVSKDKEERDDLISEGEIAARKAADDFDPGRGFKFTTYAYPRILKAMVEATSKQVRVVNISMYMEDAIRRVKKAGDKLAQKLGRKPTMEEISKTLGIPSDQVESILELDQKSISLDRQNGEDGENFLPDSDEDQKAFYGPLLADKRSEVEKSLSKLTQTEAEVLRLRYLGSDGYYQSREEIGERIGKTPERIRQIEVKALRKLRRRISPEAYKAFINRLLIFST